MKNKDGRSLSRATLEEIRIRAVERLEAGESHEVVVRSLGFSRPRIYEWLPLYREGARIRAKVAHPFHVVKNLFRHRKTRYRELAKKIALLFSLFGLANLVLARRRLLALDARSAS